MTEQDIRAALAAPFAADEVHWMAKAVTGQRAMAVAFVSARAVMDRLDGVLGHGGWQDAYDLLADGCAVCRLSIRIGGEWVTRADVGSDGGGSRKAAFSAALKRAAVKFGVGRYLYRLPEQWLDYDPKKRQFLRAPGLPPWALPRPTPEQLARLAALRKSRGDDAVRAAGGKVGIRNMAAMSDRQAADLIAELDSME
jgi:hypothetical protein